MTKLKKKFTLLTLALLTCALIFTSFGLIFSPKASDMAQYPEYSETVYENNMARPFWKSNIIFNEACSPISRWDSEYEYGYSTHCALTKFKPIKILSVKDHTLQITYEEGVDYVVDAENHKLTFPTGGALASKGLDSRTAIGNSDTETYVQQVNQAYQEYGSNVTRDPGNNTTWDPQGGNPYTSTYTIMAGVTYNEVMLFPQTYLYVTYVYDTTELPNGILPAYDPDSLTTFQSVLKGSKQDIKILSIGDSISAGCNATGGISGMTWPLGEPYQPTYQQLVANELSARYNKNVSIEYASSGGTTSAWPFGTSAAGGEKDVNGKYGGDVIDAALTKADYDLAIIAYGMNDAGMSRSGSSFQNNIKGICDMVLADNPDCDIILMNSFPRNPIASATLGSNIDNLLRNDYLVALNNVRSTLGGAKCRVLDMHAIGDFYLGKGNYTSETYNKKYFEISASNMNHPNDSFHRMYAMQITSSLYDYDTVSYQELFDMSNTVTFDSNGGSAVTNQTVKYNQSATEPTAPTRTGFTFDGWYLNGEAYDFNTAVLSDITLIAKWTLAQGSSSSETKWTVTFNYNDGVTPNSTQQISDGETATSTATPPRENYEFVGWYLNGEPYDFIKIVTEDIELVAKWKATSTDVKDMFTVTFDSDGGSAVNPVILYDGDKVSKPTDPTKAKHQFLGWTLNGNPYDFSASVTSDITLVANWELIFSLSDYVNVSAIDDNKTSILPSEYKHYTGWGAVLINFNQRIPEVENHVTAQGGWSTGSGVGVDFLQLSSPIITYTDSEGNNKLQGVNLRESYLFVWSTSGYAVGDILTIEAGTTWGNYQVKQKLIYICQGPDQSFILSPDSLIQENTSISNIWLWNTTAWGAPTIQIQLNLPSGLTFGQWQDSRSTVDMVYEKASGGNGGLADFTYTEDNKFVIRLADNLSLTNSYYAATGDKFTIKAGSSVIVGLTEFIITTTDLTYIITDPNGPSGTGISPYTNYTVTFSPNGGTLTDEATQSVATLGTASEPSAPTKEATVEYTYTFDCWTLNGMPYSFSTPVTKNIELVAKWTQSKRVYTVTFNANGGTLTGNASEPVEYGATLPAISNPTLTDSYFIGWLLNDQPYDMSTTIVGDIELVANWSTTPITVTFESNGGALTGNESEIVEYGAFASTSAPTKEATNEFTYTFAGWTLNDQPFNIASTPITESITLVAKWTQSIRTYTVTFNANGGTLVGNASVQVNYGATVAMPTAPTKAGYTFAGWMLNDVAYDFDTEVTEAIELVASWTENIPEPEPEPAPAPAKGGCGSAIGSVVIPSIIALLGAGAIVAKKRRK